MKGTMMGVRYIWNTDYSLIVRLLAIITMLQRKLVRFIGGPIATCVLVVLIFIAWRHYR